MFLIFYLCLFLDKETLNYPPSTTLPPFQIFNNQRHFSFPPPPPHGFGFPFCLPENSFPSLYRKASPLGPAHSSHPLSTSLYKREGTSLETHYNPSIESLRSKAKLYYDSLGKLWFILTLELCYLLLWKQLYSWGLILLDFHLKKKVCGDVSFGILLCKMSKFIICWECAPRKSMQSEPQRIFMIPRYIDLNIHVNLFWYAHNKTYYLLII